jgi:hypothetical protein
LSTAGELVLVGIEDGGMFLIRHRWAAGLSILPVIIAVGFMAYWRESRPEPFPPKYSVAPFMEDPGTCSDSSGSCYEVYTNATSEKSLTYITKQVAWQPSVRVEVEFHHSPDGDQFAEGIFNDGSVYIVYT